MSCASCECYSTAFSRFLLHLVSEQSRFPVVHECQFQLMSTLRNQFVHNCRYRDTQCDLFCSSSFHGFLLLLCTDGALFLLNFEIYRFFENSSTYTQVTEFSRIERVVGLEVDNLRTEAELRRRQIQSKVIRSPLTSMAYSKEPFGSTRLRLMMLFVGLNCWNLGFSGSRSRFSAIVNSV